MWNLQALRSLDRAWDSTVSDTIIIDQSIIAVT